MPDAAKKIQSTLNAKQLSIRMNQSSLTRSPERVLLVGIPSGLGNRSRNDRASCRLDVDRLNSALGTGRFRSVESFNSIKSPIRRVGPPLGELCSSLRLAFAFVVIFRTQPSSAPPMLSSPVGGFDGAVVDVDSNEGGGDCGARLGRCCAKNLLSPSSAGPGAIDWRSRVPTPGPESWIPLRCRWCRDRPLNAGDDRGDGLYSEGAVKEDCAGVRPSDVTDSVSVV